METAELRSITIKNKKAIINKGDNKINNKMEEW